MTGSRAYAGIGSRQTPAPMLGLMRSVARSLGMAGYRLRSGGADGADAAFAHGARDSDAPRTVYLPWKRFNDVGDEGAIAFDRLPGAERAMTIAAAHHPAWDRLTPPVRRLMARNVMQILGDDCASPSRFVICWAPGTKLDDDGQVCNVSGGTGQAVRIAYAHGVTVFNLALSEHELRIRRWLLSLARAA